MHIGTFSATTTVGSDPVAEQFLSDYSEVSTIYRDGPFSNLGTDYYDPSDLTLGTLRKMRNEDAQVNAALKVQSLAVLAKGWEVHYTGKQDNGEEMVEFLTNTFEMVGGYSTAASGFSDALSCLIEDRLTFGPLVIEPVYDLVEGKVVLSKVKIVQPETVEDGIYFDRHGNLEKIIQRTAGGEHDLNINKLIYWLGKSELMTVYKNWLIKDYVIKFWNIALERYGSPLLVGSVRHKKDLGTMRDLLDSIRTSTNLSIMKGEVIEAIQAIADGGNFKDAVLYHDTQLMRGLLVPSLLLGQEDVGARALGDTHLNVFLWRVQDLQRRLQNIIGRMIKVLIDVNFGKPDKYPILSFPPLSIADKLGFAKLLEILLNGEVVTPDEAWIRKELGIPQREGAAEGDPGQPIVRAPDQPSMKPTPTDRPSVVDPDIINPHPARTNSFSDLAWQESLVEVNDIVTRGERRLTRELRTYLNDLKDEWVAAIPGSDDSIFSDADFKLPSLEPAEDQIDAAVAVMNSTYIESVNLTEQNLAALRREGKLTKNMQGEPEWFATRMTEAYSVQLSSLTDGAATALADAAGLQLTVREVRAGLVDLIDAKIAAAGGISTTAVTNINAAFNVGRWEVMTANRDFVTGYRYSSILDQGTTPFCREHHNETIALNDPNAKENIPPNHYRCRATIVPVTVLDTDVSFEWNENVIQESGFQAPSVGLV